MKLKILVGVLLVIIAVFLTYYILQKQALPMLIIDSFEGKITGGQDATVDYGSGAGAKVSVFPGKSTVYHRRQSLKIVYDNSEGGYMWIARGYNLTIKNAAQWRVRPEKIKWDKYDALVFYLYGEGSGNDIAVDIIDSGKEYWRYLINDDIKGWKEIVIPFSDFSARKDWQPDNADRNNKMDFPINVYQFEPKTGVGTIYVDKICLRKRGEV